jgi:hypothetical protein
LRKAGRVSTGAAKRMRLLPEIPTVAESGVPGYEAVAWFGLFGPPGVLFFDKQGREQTDARVVGFVPAQGFVASLGAVGL